MFNQNGLGEKAGSVMKIDIQYFFSLRRTASKVLLLCLLFSHESELLAATGADTIIVLSEVSVVSRIVKLNSENNIVSIDSSVIQSISGESLSDLLSKYANVSIKAYGVSGISSLSIRGGGTSHTAVVWNGFNLQDQLNGGFNFALAPAFIADKIDVKYGGSSAVYGSGAMGGTISMSNTPNFNNGLGSKSALFFGSFGLMNFQQQLSFGNDRFYLSAKGFYSSVDNDFSYTNMAKPGFPTDTLCNAAIEQYGLLVDGYYKFGTRQMLSAHFWAQNNNSEVPPNMISANGYALQYENWDRLALEWQLAGENVSWEIRNGTFYSYLNYVNDGIGIDALHTSLNNVSEVISDVKVIRKSSLEIAVNNNYTMGNSDNFSETESLNKLAFFASFKTKLVDNTVLNVNVREELVSGELKPVTFGLFGEYSFSEHWIINSNVSKNHRTPTFNDLYWKDAYAIGNSDLKDESGYSTDLSFIVKHKFGRVTTERKITGYFNSTYDLIQWVQDGAVWTPMNRKKVHSYGAEMFCSSSYEFSESSVIGLTVNYTYTHAATIENSENDSDDILNKQLIYTPYHQGNIFVNYRFKDIRISLNGDFTGDQFTRDDNSDYLKAYFVVDLNTSYSFWMKRCRARVFVKVKNLFNADYMQMQWYPMPPVNFEAGVSFGLSEK
jgi:iron complex outermembrane receptor protein